MKRFLAIALFGCAIYVMSAQTTTIGSTGTVTPKVTDSGLTSGNCVQASTAGLLTTTAGPCGTSAVHNVYSWVMQPTEYLAAIPIGAIFYVPATATSATWNGVVHTLNGTCTTWPSMTITDLGTSASGTIAGGTTIATIAPSGNGATTGTGTFTFTAGHYLVVSLGDTASCTTQPFVDTSLTY